MYRRNRPSIEFKQVYLVLVLIVVGASQSHAAIIMPDDFSGNEILIDFGNADDYPVPNPYTVSGVSFLVQDSTIQGMWIRNSRPDLFDNILGASLGGAYFTGLATATLYIDFGSHQVRRAGLLASNIDGIATFQLRAFDSTDTLLGSVDVTQPATEEAVFLGLEFPQLIDRLELQRIASTTFQHSNIIDDVRFEPVPEPSSFIIWSLLATFAMCLGRHRR